jgi:cell division protein FtsQ
VRAAKVRKIFPDTLEIVLQQRIPLALSFSYTDEKMVPVAFDEEGMLFQIGNAVTQWDLPVISGLRFKPILGLQLPSRLAPFLEEMKALRENAPELFDLVSEIKVTSTNEIDYELLLYPVGYSTRIHLGERIDEDSIKYALMVLDVLQDQGMVQNIEELDFRGGDVVYRLKEG